MHRLLITIQCNKKTSLYIYATGMGPRVYSLCLSRAQVALDIGILLRPSILQRLINIIYPATCCQRFNFLNLRKHVAATCCREQHRHTDDQQVPFNMFLSTCFPKVAQKSPQATCWKEHVERNMLKATCCLRQHLGNMLKGTCWKEHVACGNIWATC